MKKTVIISLLLAALLNIWQYARSEEQRQVALLTPPAQTTGGTEATSVVRPAATRTPLPSAPAPAVPTASPSPAAKAADPVARAQASLTAAGMKPDYAATYLAAAARTGTPWQLLAAVHKTETGQRGDTAVTSSAGAQGPMQFLPATFSHYRLDGDGDGRAQITDADDAITTAGNYLAANGASAGRYSTALYAYNHSSSYVSAVLATAHQLGLSY